MQVQNGQERIIGYHSRCFDKGQRKTCTTQRELYALIDSLKQYKVYLYNPFTIRTDHNSLKWLMNFKNLDGKLGRWLDFLATFPDFVIEYRPGKRHILPDRASRRPCTGCKHCDRLERKYTWMSDVGVQCNLGGGDTEHLPGFRSESPMDQNFRAIKIPHNSGIGYLASQGCHPNCHNF